MVLVSVLTLGSGIFFSVEAAENHPRILLDGNALSTLREKARTNDVSWTKLKAQCDGYVNDQVEYPDGKDYGDQNVIGEGYQGDGYVEPVLSLGVCYQAVKTQDSALAQKYADRGIDILVKMSAPKGTAHYQDPLRDSGYGIRNFGVGMALGYDWLYEKMSSFEKERVYTSLNHWVEQFEQKGFGYEHPQGNYFAGYYAAKALAALATEGDNPQAGDMWNTWLTKHQEVVQPYYEKWMKGGGWPEGWNYGALATKNMLWPLVAAKTAKNIDLIRDGARPLSFANDQALNLIHFSWPNRKTLDDRGKIYRGDNPAATQASLYTFMSGALEALGMSNAPLVHNFAREVRAFSNSGAAWEDFVFWNSNAMEYDYKNLARSYVASGMNQVALRSSWATDAVWASFAAGPYINYPGSGEEFFDQGSLAIVKGNTPFLVNATGALLRNKTAGTNDTDYEEQIYKDNFGTQDRSLYNVFYTGKGQIAKSPNIKTGEAPRTRVVGFEDAGGFTAFTGVHLEDMYRDTVKSWTRDVVYIRPDIFVVHDETEVTGAEDTQHMSFHLTYTPQAQGILKVGNHRYEVRQNGNYIGSATAVYPIQKKSKLVNVFESNKVFRFEISPAVSGPRQSWVTVFDVSTSENAVQPTALSSSPGTVATFLQTTKGNYVVAFYQKAPSTSELAYTVSRAKTTHIINGLQPGNYSVALDPMGNETKVIVRAGGSVKTSAEGRLYFTTENGTSSEITYSSSSGSSGSSGDLSSSDPLPDELNSPYAETVPLYKLWNKTTKSEFYVMDEEEYLKRLKSTRVWEDRGMAQRVIPASICSEHNGVPVYEFNSRYRGKNIYTIKSAERAYLRLAAQKRSWVEKPVTFCAYKDSSYGGVPVYRFRNKKTSIYTYIMAGQTQPSSALWVNEGVAYYAVKP